MSTSAPSNHESTGELALPAPSTTRTLRPRSRAVSLARSAHSGSLSRPASRTSSRSQNMSATRRSVSPGDALFLQALIHHVGDGLEGRSLSQPTRAGKRKQTGAIVRRRRAWRDSWNGSDDEEVDQLISDDDEMPPVPSTSASVAGPSTQGSFLESQTSQSSPPRFVSSRSLAKILHPNDVEPQTISPKSLHDHKPTTSAISPISPILAYSKPPAPPTPSPERQAEPLSEYTCPICFFPPTNATLTPCGHMCCGACLFTAVKTTMQRGGLMMGRGEPNVARCPVCRAEIKGWDGRGGGVVGIKARAIFSI